MKLASIFAAAAVVLFVNPAVAGQMNDPQYLVDFTDSNGDVANLIFNAASGVVTSVDGTFNGQNVTEANVFGSDEIVYNTGPLVDYSGVSFQDLVTSAYYNLYWTNEFVGGPVVLGLCYQVGCDSQSGFYTLTGERVTVPEPATFALLGAGLAGLCVLRRRRQPAKAV